MLSLNHSSEHPWVVLVEDDESLRGQLASALELALPDVQVQRTPDADVALNLVRDNRSRLLITEAQTASVDGLALAACARRQRPQLPLIFLADPRVAAASAHELRGSHLVDKPPRLDQFVDLVARVLEPPPGFRGELSTTGVLELVQLVAMTMPTGALHLSGQAGSGTLWFENGSVVHAVQAHDRGNAALQRMLRWGTGHFNIETAACAPERSVTGSMMELLMDAARRFDEDAEARAQAREREVAATPREEATREPEVDRDEERRRLTRESHVAIRAVRAREVASEPSAGEQRRAAVHFEAGLQAVWRKDYARALPEWERAAELDPQNRLYHHNLMRLRHLINMDRGQELEEVSDEHKVCRSD